MLLAHSFKGDRSIFGNPRWHRGSAHFWKGSPSLSEPRLLQGTVWGLLDIHGRGVQPVRSSGMGGELKNQEAVSNAALHERFYSHALPENMSLCPYLLVGILQGLCFAVVMHQQGIRRIPELQRARLLRHVTDAGQGRHCRAMIS
eukprot:1160979-Pelagomonas_calceolata.AAC.10